MSSGLEYNLQTIRLTNNSYLIYICIKQELALNNLQGLVCQKPNQPTNQPTINLYTNR